MAGGLALAGIGILLLYVWLREEAYKRKKRREREAAINKAFEKKDRGIY